MRGLTDSDASCRFVSAWSAALLGQTTNNILSTLQKFVEEGEAYAERALAIFLRCLPLGQAEAYCRNLRNNPYQMRLAAIAPGVIGVPELVPEVIAMMQVTEVARVAGEAFSMITGVDLAFEDLDAEIPEGWTSGPSDDPEDEDVGMDPDQHLPWPNPDLAFAWWQKNCQKFHPQKRYLRGEEIKQKNLQKSLLEGLQRQRLAAAVELALLAPQQPLFNVFAKGKKQHLVLKLFKFCINMENLMTKTYPIRRLVELLCIWADDLGYDCRKMPPLDDQKLNNVFANGRAISCKSGSGKVLSAFPDVSLSPPSPPAGPVPIPYPLFSSQLPSRAALYGCGQSLAARG
jgi:hypothetical protein